MSIAKQYLLPTISKASGIADDQVAARHARIMCSACLVMRSVTSHHHVHGHARIVICSACHISMWHMARHVPCMLHQHVSVMCHACCIGM